MIALTARLLGFGFCIMFLTGAVELVPADETTIPGGDVSDGNSEALAPAVQPNRVATQGIERRVEELKAIARFELSRDPGDRRSLSASKRRMNGSALLTLGLLHYHGISVETDVRLARELFLRARGLGNRASSIGVAWCLLDGCGNAPNTRALTKVLGEVGRVDKGREAYFVYLRDRAPTEVGGATLTADSLRKLKIAVNYNDAYALNERGLLALRREAFDEALNYFKRAASRGSEAAAGNLDLLQSRGVGADPAADTDAPAAGLYQQARRLHRNGRSADDYVKALALYQAAAEKGDAAAQKMLALIFSRPGTNARAGQVDPVWMRQTAHINLGSTGGVGVTAQMTYQTDTSPLLDLLPAVFREAR